MIDSPVAVPQYRTHVPNKAIVSQDPLEAKDIMLSSSPVFQQKIRRLFLKYPFFQYDGVSHDVKITQAGNLLSILVNVSRHSAAQQNATAIWNLILKALTEKGAEIEFNEVNLLEDQKHINFFLGTDILLKLR